MQSSRQENTPVKTTGSHSIITRWGPTPYCQHPNETQINWSYIFSGPHYRVNHLTIWTTESLLDHSVSLNNNIVRSDIDDRLDSVLNVLNAHSDISAWCKSNMLVALPLAPQLRLNGLCGRTAREQIVPGVG